LFCCLILLVSDSSKLEVYLECPPDRVRARPGNLVDSLKLRVLRDSGPSLPPVKFLFQCRDMLEQVFFGFFFKEKKSFVN
jgi:hypothetical protein